MHFGSIYLVQSILVQRRTILVQCILAHCSVPDKDHISLRQMLYQGSSPLLQSSCKSATNVALNCCSPQNPLKSSQRHCFVKDTMLQARDGRYVLVQDLRLGDLIIAADGSFVQVVEARLCDGVQELVTLSAGEANLTVTQSHRVWDIFPQIVPSASTEACSVFRVHLRNHEHGVHLLALGGGLTCCQRSFQSRNAHWPPAGPT